MQGATPYQESQLCNFEQYAAMTSVSVLMMYAVLQFNLTGFGSERDLGVARTLDAHKMVQRSLWQRLPLLYQIEPEHPVFSLGVFDDLKATGVWYDWVNVMLKWHEQVEGVQKALSAGPMMALANMVPPHLIVAQLLEPVNLSVIVICMSAVWFLMIVLDGQLAELYFNTSFQSSSMKSLCGNIASYAGAHTSE